VAFRGVANVWRIFAGFVADPFCTRCRHGESEMAMVCVSVVLMDVGSDKTEMRMEM
jgi:hypothetical protein